MKIHHAFLLVAILLSGLSQCKKPQPAEVMAMPKPATAGPSYSAIIAKGYVLNREIQAPGSILAEENTNLQSEISGRIIGIYFKEGNSVSKGALLFKLYDGDLKAQRSKLEVQLKIAEASEGRQKELLALNGTSQQEYDLATLQVSNIKADLDLNSVSLGKTEIRAPYAGKIGLRNVSLGAYITPQNVLANLAQISSLKIEFNVLEKYAQDLKVGHTVHFNTETSDRTYLAKITAFENTLTNDTRQQKLRAQVIKPDQYLTPGSFIYVNFGVGSQEPTIMVPAQAIIPEARDRKVILNKNGTAVFATVVTGYRDSSRVEILSGLQIGDTVVTSGLMAIRPGSKIIVNVVE
ncbi:MAG: efflux RND transporter periplasmic adaptor subunit [Saprospiraceae bacterium]|nr:efflux RND transporter periplasmic adaptor subunit [Saprospiraceae bacterium]